MKRIVLISAAAAAAMLLSFSCQKEEQTGDNPGKGKILTVTASIGDVVSDTKTYIDGTETSPKTYWSEGDKIKLFDESGNAAVYKISSWTAKQTSATFVLDDGQTELSGTFACAYYPADSAKSYADGNITVNIPSAQKYVAGVASKNAGTFANGASPMVGTGTLDETKGNLDLTFKNLFGVLQLTFKSDATITTVSRIDVASAADTAFFGTLTVTPQETEEGTPSCDFETPDESWRQVSLVMESPVTLDGTDGTSFYIVLPAGVNTARIGVTTNDGLYYKDVTKSVGRSHIKPLAASTLSAAGFSKATYSEATASAAVMVEGMIWAPVNCGYDATYPYGKLYQWGRAVGGGYDDGLTYEEPVYQDATESAPSGTAQNDNPTDNVFYKGVYEWYDWYTTSGTQLSLWPMKSGDAGYVASKIANPCPDGWRVPTYEELNTLFGGNSKPSFVTVEGQQGAYFNGTSAPGSTGVFLPAAGYRSYSDGDAGGRGSNGDYWSSSVKGNKACYLYLDKTYAGVETDGCRAFGHPVRCVQE